MELQWSYNICSFTKDTLLYKFFSRFLLRNFAKFCLPENHLVTDANPCKILKTFISLKVRVYKQHHRLWSEKALDVQGFEWKSNCTEMAKYTCDFKHKIYFNVYIYIYISKPSQAVYFIFSRGVFRTLSNVFASSLIGGNYFHKKLHLRHLERF